MSSYNTSEIIVVLLLDKIGRMQMLPDAIISLIIAVNKAKRTLVNVDSYILA